MANPNPLQIWWQEQTPRDQKVLLGGGAIMFLMIVVFAGVRPLWQAHQSANERVEKRHEDLLELVKLEKTIKSKPASNNQFGKGLGTDSPIGLIEGIAARVGVKDRIRNIKPGSAEQEGSRRYMNISFQMEELTMTEYVDLLYQIEVGSGLDIEVVRMKSSRKERQNARLELTMDLRILL